MSQVSTPKPEKYNYLRTKAFAKMQDALIELANWSEANGGIARVQIEMWKGSVQIWDEIVKAKLERQGIK